MNHRASAAKLPDSHSAQRVVSVPSLAPGPMSSKPEVTDHLARLRWPLKMETGVLERGSAINQNCREEGV